VGAQGARLALLGEFNLLAAGMEQPLAAGSRRLLALLALMGQRMRRRAVAGTLWPDADDTRAGASLRSTLSRLGRSGGQLVCVNGTVLSLNPAISVDLREAQAEARRLLVDEAPLSPADRRGDTAALLSLELLPGWYDDWVLIEAEAWRQLRLHALEALSVRLTKTGCHAAAILAALAAVSADPLRESARSVLIRGYLAEGNRSDALREFARYRRLLRGSLGVEPSPRLRALAGTELCPTALSPSRTMILG
jgi:SARP family transcriptional regulator, regulator of embCAB operon